MKIEEKKNLVGWKFCLFQSYEVDFVISVLLHQKLRLNKLVEDTAFHQDLFLIMGQGLPKDILVIVPGQNSRLGVRALEFKFYD